MPNPVGSYRREFILPDSWKGRDIFIRFNGVEAGFYIWVNGKKVGYSEDSYLPAEFNLTPYLKAGKIVLAVEVYRFTDGSFLECQDFWRLSGIERDVYIYSNPNVSIKDFRITSTLDDTYKNGIFKLTMDIRNTGSQTSKDYIIGYKVFDPKTNKVIAESEKNSAFNANSTISLFGHTENRDTRSKDMDLRTPQSLQTADVYQGRRENCGNGSFQYRFPPYRD